MTYDHARALEAAEWGARHFVDYAPGVVERLFRDEDSVLAAALAKVLADQVDEVEAFIREVGASDEEAKAVASVYRSTLAAATVERRRRTGH